MYDLRGETTPCILPLLQVPSLSRLRKSMHCPSTGEIRTSSTQCIVKHFFDLVQRLSAGHVEALTVKGCHQRGYTISLSRFTDSNGIGL